MDFKNSKHMPESIKEEFKEWLKKYHAALKSRNESLKSELIAKQQRNNALKDKIQRLTNKQILNRIVSPDAISSAAQNAIENMSHSLKTAIEQLEECKKAIDEKAEHDIKETRKKLYELTIKDDITLKPFHEVEKAIDEINQKINAMKQQLKEEQQIFNKNQRKCEQQFAEITETISISQPIEKEIRHEVKKAQKCLNDKLKSLNLKSVEEATMESSEAKELLNNIETMKAQLNK